MALSVISLVESLCQSRLLEPAQEAVLVRDLQGEFPDPQQLAKELVRRGWLTAYQLTEVAQGRGADLLLGPYIILDRIGAGGMGFVYKARHRDQGRILALKLLRKEFVSHPLALQRFIREALAVTQLDHPNIVRAYEGAQVGSVPFLAMEYVRGIDLGRLVEQSGPLPIYQACDFARQAALGLQHAHERGVVHRDIKPRNLLVTRPGPDAPIVLKILDFGLARLESDQDRENRLTRLGRTMGTIDYMAPEQAENCREADTRADIYSLGCALFYCLTARTPFAEDDLGTRLIREAPPVQPLRLGISAELGAVLARMLARDPNRRYQLPAQVAAALQPFSVKPDRAEPPPLPVTMPRPAGRPSKPSAEASAWMAALRRRKKRRLALLAGGAAFLVLLVPVLILALSPGPRDDTKPGGDGNPSLRKTDDGRPPPKVKPPVRRDGTQTKPKKKEEEEEPPPKDAGRPKRTFRDKKEEVEEEPAGKDGKPVRKDKP